jgi:hypothetical protein
MHLDRHVGKVLRLEAGRGLDLDEVPPSPDALEDVGHDDHPVMLERRS